MTACWISAHKTAAKRRFQTTGYSMSPFTFEIVRQGDRPVIAKVMTLSGDRAIWCQVEALALRVEDGDGASIRVKNSKGEIVIRTGVATALASIEKCSCTSCPLKEGLQRHFSDRRRPKIGLPAHFVPCGKRGNCACNAKARSTAASSGRSHGEANPHPLGSERRLELLGD
jgi:hypothetical protein